MTQRESINLGIYSCNWTMTNLKLKKLLLLTMQINDANQVTMKVSMRKLVNLNLFANVSIYIYILHSMYILLVYQ